MTIETLKLANRVAANQDAILVDISFATNSKESPKVGETAYPTWSAYADMRRKHIKELTEFLINLT